MVKDYTYLIGQIINDVSIVDIKRKGHKIYAVGNCIHCNKKRNIVVSDLVKNKNYQCTCTHRKYEYDEFQIRLYRIYHHIKDRCYNSNNHAYKNYGERGIKMCQEWYKDFATFKNWAIHNGYTNELTIDRIDNDGNYDPLNCRWITLGENVAKSNKEHPRK